MRFERRKRTLHERKLLLHVSQLRVHFTHYEPSRRGDARQLHFFEVFDPSRGRHRRHLGHVAQQCRAQVRRAHLLELRQVLQAEAARAAAGGRAVEIVADPENNLEQLAQLIRAAHLPACLTEREACRGE